MSLKEELQRFLDDVDPKIFHRGLDYYHADMVDCLQRSENRVTAEVSGSEAEPYRVELILGEDGRVAEWSCSCPYDWGPVCKHVVAVLLVLQEVGVKESSNSEDAAKRSAVLQALVERAGREQLAALVLAHCQEDPHFQGEVLSVLEDSGECELESVKALIQQTIRVNSRHGCVNRKGCAAVCAELESALTKARRRLDRGQWDRALELARAVLLAGVSLADDLSGSSLDKTVDAALELLSLSVGALAENRADRTAWVQRLLETAEDAAFDGWPGWRYDLLERTAVLANAENEWAFYDALSLLSDRRRKSFPDTPRYTDQDKLIRYQVLRHAHGEPAGRAYLERNLDVDVFRERLIETYIREGNDAAAEALCQERIAEKLPKRLSYWQYLLYKIYQNMGRRERQIQQARTLTLLGAEGFYQTTKDLLMEDGRWAEELPGFLAELKAARPVREYMDILSQENETALLMEQVRLHRSEVFRYAVLLAPQYGGEVRGLCAGVIREAGEQMRNGRDYQQVCELLWQLTGLGGAAEALTIIAELREAYPHRPALWKALDGVEQRIQKKSEYL